ncbi:MAG TPA: ABC transporter ATP-binding protein [Rhizomicrobium sp.]|jgi:ABC-2 type transport system ATP-binding protein|nr:ABC transporter ATP-binding protein [Rhizomicrobium sp.]
MGLGTPVAAPQGLAVTNVGVRFGNQWALDGVSLDFPRGVTALLGPNGAGKSTLLAVLATIVPPDRGRVTFEGRDLAAGRIAYCNRLGYAPQQVDFPLHATVKDILHYVGALKAVPARARREQIEILCDRLNLRPWIAKKTVDLSGGVRRRLIAALALIGAPQVLLADEPTAELDPVERRALQDLLLETARHATVIVSTHLMAEIEWVADAVVVMAKGRVLRTAAPAQLKDELHGRIWSFRIARDRAAEACAAGVVIAVQPAGEAHQVRIVGDRPPCEDAIPQTPTLEDAYLAILAGNG